MERALMPDTWAVRRATSGSNTSSPGSWTCDSQQNKHSFSTHIGINLLAVSSLKLCYHEKEKKEKKKEKRKKKTSQHTHLVRDWSCARPKETESNNHRNHTVKL
jgi:hypothetical protein